MNMNEMKNTLPKSTRTPDFDKYSSKSGFCAEAVNVSEKAREVIKNELSNIFTLEPHKSGQFIAATLYFGGASVEPEDRYKYVVIDCRTDDLECEFAANIKETKAKIRALVSGAPYVAPETTPETEPFVPQKPEPAKSKKAKKAAEKPAEPATEPATEPESETF